MGRALPWREGGAPMSVVNAEALFQAALDVVEATGEKTEEFRKLGFQGVLTAAAEAMHRTRTIAVKVELPQTDVFLMANRDVATHLEIEGTERLVEFLRKNGFVRQIPVDREARHPRSGPVIWLSLTLGRMR